MDDMEKSRSKLLQVDTLKAYTPYEGLPRSYLVNKKWEMVYFLSPFCDGTCAHCWSSETFLGRFMPISWHQSFWGKVNPLIIKEVRLTGGEPFLYKDIGKVVKIVRSSLGDKIPIKIFTSGRSILSFKEGKEGIKETINKILNTGIIVPNIEIYLSADEHHAGSLFRKNRRITTRPNSLQEIRKMNSAGIPLLQTQVKNFLIACDLLKQETAGKFRGGKLKIHAEVGRLKYHREHVFSWIDDYTWKSRVICSEGVIKAGSAKQLKRTEDVHANANLSLFILPGAEFYSTPQTTKAQEYISPQNKQSVFLDLSRENGDGASVIGWWNIINRVFCGGKADDIFKLKKSK